MRECFAVEGDSDWKVKHSRTLQSGAFGCGYGQSTAPVAYGSNQSTALRIDRPSSVTNSHTPTRGTSARGTSARGTSVLGILVLAAEDTATAAAAAKSASWVRAMRLYTQYPEGIFRSSSILPDRPRQTSLRLSLSLAVVSVSESESESETVVCSRSLLLSE